jgi:hypothetical protein
VLLTKRGWNRVDNQWVFAYESKVITKDAGPEAILRTRGRKVHELSGAPEAWREKVAGELLAVLGISLKLLSSLLVLLFALFPLKSLANSNSSR